MLVAAALLASAIPQCTVATSVRTSVEELAREPNKWFGRCVRLDGYVDGYTFFSNAKGRYRRFASDKNDHPNDGWLGLYFDGHPGARKESSRISITGVVDDCGRIYDGAIANAGPNDIVWMIGYCHYQEGLFLKQVRVISRVPYDFERETGEAARVAFGDLELPDEAHPIPDKVRQLVGEFEKAFAANNKTAMLRLAYPI